MTIELVRTSAEAARVISGLVRSLYERRASGTQLRAKDFGTEDTVSFSFPADRLSDLRNLAHGTGLSFAAVDVPGAEQITVIAEKKDGEAFRHLCEILTGRPGQMRAGRPGGSEAKDAGIVDEHTETGQTYYTFELEREQTSAFLREARRSDLPVALSEPAAADAFSQLRRGEILAEGLPFMLSQAEGARADMLRGTDAPLGAAFVTHDVYVHLETDAPRMLPFAALPAGNKVLLLFRAGDGKLLSRHVPEMQPVRTVSVRELEDRLGERNRHRRITVLVPERALPGCRRILAEVSPGFRPHFRRAGRAADFSREREPLAVRLARAAARAAAGREAAERSPGGHGRSSGGEVR